MGGFFIVRVPASTSNLGAGFDCLGLALDLWLEARLSPGGGSPRYTGAVESLSPQNDFIHSTLAASGVLEGSSLEVHSDIPISRGLGSSAAARVAAVALSLLAKGVEPSRARVYNAAAEDEGHPDNAGPAVYGGLVLAAHAPTHLPLHPDIAVALAIPDRLVETSVARAILPDTLGRSAAVEQAARSAALVMGLGNGDGDLIQFGMEDRIAVAYRKSAIAGFDKAVVAGRSAGAFGVTISGAGSTLLAFAHRGAVSEVSEAMAQALSACDNPASAMTPEIATDGLTIVDQ